jgi:hypothetical protein
MVFCAHVLAAIAVPAEMLATGPYVVAAMLCALVAGAYRVVIVFRALRGTTPEQRAPILLALEAILRSPAIGVVDRRRPSDTSLHREQASGTASPARAEDPD